METEKGFRPNRHTPVDKKCSSNNIIGQPTTTSGPKETMIFLSYSVTTRLVTEKNSVATRFASENISVAANKNLGCNPTCSENFPITTRVATNKNLSSNPTYN
jgi:hypothetical protein